MVLIAGDTSCCNNYVTACIQVPEEQQHQQPQPQQPDQSQGTAPPQAQAQQPAQPAQPSTSTQDAAKLQQPTAVDPSSLLRISESAAAEAARYREALQKAEVRGSQLACWCCARLACWTAAVSLPCRLPCGRCFLPLWPHVPSPFTGPYGPMSLPFQRMNVPCPYLTKGHSCE